MNKAYDATLMEIGRQVAEEMGIGDIVHKGVYTCLGGPNFETVAELKMLRMIGVDAVGTSLIIFLINRAKRSKCTLFTCNVILTNIFNLFISKLFNTGKNICLLFCTY